MADTKPSNVAVITAAPPQVSLADGLQNLATGLGTGKDKAMGNQWIHSNRNVDHVTLSARFREDWISQKVCKVVPQDMTREWRKCSVCPQSTRPRQWPILLSKQGLRQLRNTPCVRRLN